MRSKHILSIFAFITAFVLSSAFAWLFIDKSQTGSNLTFELRNARCQQDAETKRAIENLLEQDIRNGRERLWRANDTEHPSAKSHFDRYAEAVEHYADDSGSMRYNHLPRDFQIRWNEHMRAWRDYSNYLNRSNSSSLEDEDFYQDRNEYLVDINSTWYSVLRVGKKYCAEVTE
jgi:hypothetical protein